MKGIMAAIEALWRSLLIFAVTTRLRRRRVLFFRLVAPRRAALRKGYHAWGLLESRRLLRIMRSVIKGWFRLHDYREEWPYIMSAYAHCLRLSGAIIKLL